LQAFWPILFSLKLRKNLSVTLVTRKGYRGDGWFGELIEEMTSRSIMDLSSTQISRIDSKKTGVAIAQLETNPLERYVLKVALHKSAAKKIAKQSRNVKSLLARGDLPNDLLTVIPRVIESGQFRNHTYLLEVWLPGENCSTLMFNFKKRKCEEVIDLSLEWITTLHRNTMRIPYEPSSYGTLTRRVLSRISEWAGEEDCELANQLAVFLEERLRAFNLPGVQGHGDYWLGNILIDPDGRHITGVLDWDYSDHRAPVLEDVFNLIFFRKGIFTTWILGARLSNFLRGRVKDRDRIRIHSYIKTLDIDPRALGSLAVLYWVRYLAAHEFEWDRYRRMYLRTYWLVRNAVQPQHLFDLDKIGEKIFKS
jgi:aminoglycoside phosphotransferase (APT) family kinase protein